MHLFAIVALKRADHTEAVIALRIKEEDSRRSAREYAVAMADEFIRCRVQPMDLTVEQVKAICFRWGQEDARKGEPVPNTLPGVYGEEYRRGFESVWRSHVPLTPSQADASDSAGEPP
ncbi:MAG: hypothetical protein K2P78_08410 [Gemmataceae bacterium]|nr:hypothetical protein [Gemmataceae bacterium]